MSRNGKTPPRSQPASQPHSAHAIDEYHDELGNLKAKKAYKGGTVAERVAWFERTSDIFGSHGRTDLDSYLSLIRRKIQEKCATTVELIYQIRRNKISDSSHVTPNEFRFTLIKFGIILAQPLVDKIFNVFDSDRSGTMDFDEFAMWIMNSEFRPAIKIENNKSSTPLDSPRTTLRKKLRNVINENSRAFANMKKQISFLELVSDINRLEMKLSEREARTVFQILDPRETGFIDSNSLSVWADTGKFDGRVVAKRPPELKVGSLDELISKVVGRNTKALENAFSHVKLGAGTRLPYEEFRRCLLNAGVGKSAYDVKQLHAALSERSNDGADIDLFFNKLAPMLIDPRTEISMKVGPTSMMSISRANRHLRDAIRKSYKEVKADLNALDHSGSGFVSPEVLYKVLVKRCMPLTFQDFRFILQNLKKEKGGGKDLSRVYYKHFLNNYNPSMAPHQLDLSPVRNNLSTMSTTSLSSSMDKGFNKSTFDDNMSIVSNYTTNTSTIAKAANKFGDEKDNLKQIWHQVLKECHRSDPERSGQVSRNVFISALQKADNGKTMTAESMNKLADSYTLSNGLVNYLFCFRSYLSDLTGMENSSMSKSKSFAVLDNGGRDFTTINVKPLDLRPIHPWEFNYKPNKYGDHPYWQTATTLPKDSLHLSGSLTLPVPPASEKAAGELSATEKQMILSKFEPKVISICESAFKSLAPAWRLVRNDLKRAQIKNQRGNILATHFINILESHGAVLNKNDLGVLVRVFRGQGISQDIVKYDEFLRVCLLVKNT